jgi:hypothetical protein
MAQSAATPSSPVQATLERDRLAHREWRLRRVISELRARADGGRTTGQVPVPLRRAIADFEAELRHVQRRLRRLT